ncbi:Chromosome partition protein Smc [Fervidicola ferrireducens]|uniref:Chromosome partition protein Smc n=1 Tax=Fervidicola ferrireducens TaxID=520764 RepID=A0A140L9L0_9FIRM|nr:chromosome segregation protein SMC [Fervidicola ferrireducens]KXG77235.1 Chromosome partition protein Smc [Fervidicola ferrireducens]
MYLKKIELHGFKSFADRTEIEFEPGINAIVGPNGSGKSNITDAIRWVLGEQSIKTLRGSKLEDVIFAGSQKRKPMGMAEVSIVLDNSDYLLPLEYSEVCITRRTFRSGESEFYLNKLPCRLKDIQELFMDTGIGKDGYSIISQGEVDEFLMARPEERRLIFEETAGIMKYKVRKKEAERKLEETMANLARVDDILSEIKVQLDTLYVQRMKALEYKELSERRKLLEVNLLLLEYEKISERLAKVEKVLSEKEAALLDIRGKRVHIEERMARLKEELQKKKGEYEKLRGEFFEKNTKKIELEKEKKWQEERLRKLEEDLDITAQKLDILKAKLDGAQKQFCANLEKLEQKIKEINKTDARLRKKEEELAALDGDIKEKQREMEKLKGDVIDLLNSASKIKNTIASLSTMKSNMKKRLIQIDQELKGVKEANSLTLQELENAEKRLSDVREKIEKVSEKIESEKRNLEKFTCEYRESSRLLQEKIIYLNELKSRYKILEEVNQNYEGYQQGVRNLLSHIKSGRIYIEGIYGTVAEIIKVSERLETAIESALGGALQNVVCESEQIAKKAIEYLKKNNLGRVTFLPLTSVRPRVLSSHENWVLEQSGCLGVACELINYDEKFKPVLLHLLGRVIVAEDVDSAMEIAKKTDFGLKVVTLEGEIINPGGSITGGSIKKTSLILTRKREFEEIKEKLQGEEAKFCDLKTKIVGIEERIRNTQKSIDELGKILHSYNADMAGQEREIAGKKGLLRERQEREKILNLERRQIEEELREIEQEIARVERDKNSIEELNKDRERKVENLKREIEEKLKSREAIEKEIKDLRLFLNGLKQEELSLKYQIQNLEQNVSEWKKEQGELVDNIGKLEEEIASTSNKITTLEARLKDISEEQEILKTVIENLEDDKTKLEDEMDALGKSIADIEREEKRKEVSLSETRVKQASLKVELEHIVKTLAERYSLSLEDAMDLKQGTSDVERIKQELFSVKNKIEGLGAVNMNAIEDYENLKSRYDFMKVQRDDLLEAKMKLDDLIDDLTKTMEEMFLETFKKIKTEFQKVFAELFGGGKAELILTDESKPLEAGIEIAVQPPGKKLQNLSLLSGGERALAAIALLFSILNIKSTPFCILDEIEAALDDANIDRFTRYLKKISEHTQVIIITHRKGTMEVADALYGITMEETAVSKLIAVKLEEE